MTTPADSSSCPISAATSIPAKLNQLDKCMADIGDAGGAAAGVGDACGGGAILVRRN